MERKKKTSWASLMDDAKKRTGDKSTKFAFNGINLGELSTPLEGNLQLQERDFTIRSNEFIYYPFRSMGKFGIGVVYRKPKDKFIYWEVASSRLKYNLCVICSCKAETGFALCKKCQDKIK